MPPLALLPVLAALAAASPQLPWSQGDPTPDEQDVLEWLNAARANPSGTLASILSLSGSDLVVAAYIAGELPETPADWVQELAAAVALAETNSVTYPNSGAISTAPLVFYPLFESQAAVVSTASAPPALQAPEQRPPPDYLYPTPVSGTYLAGPETGCSGPNATGGEAHFGGSAGTAAEIIQVNFYEPYITGREYILSLLTDPGSGSPPPSFLQQGDTLSNLTLGHTRMVGMSLGPATNGARALTIFQGDSEFFTQSDLPYGNLSTVFITGVAYQDANGNGVYDAGEGVGGVSIAPDHGSWYAVTASAGGYAIPVPANSGTYTLTATGGPFAGATTTVTVGADSVKADWVLPPATPTLPPQIAVPPGSGNCQMLGLSTRGLAQAGDNALIGGFAVEGPPGGSKRLLIRGVGPSLQFAGVPAAECLPGTSLQVFGGTQILASNTGWASTPDGGAAVAQAARQVGDFALANWAGGGGDSALILELPAGAYSAVVNPSPDIPPIEQTGLLGLIEIYDLSPRDGCRLVNLSARAQTAPGDSQMIVGWTIGGSGEERVLVRGIGPTLGSEFGVPGVLPNPVLTLDDSTGAPIASNDDWSWSAQANQIAILAAAYGAFALPAASADSALLADIVSGNYSAVLSAKPGTTFTGVAMVEVYETP